MSLEWRKSGKIAENIKSIRLEFYRMLYEAQNSYFISLIDAANQRW